jgi:adenine-specific DNA-methyltransferase
MIFHLPTKQAVTSRQSGAKQDFDLFTGLDPLRTISSGKSAVKAWVKNIDESLHQDFAQEFLFHVVKAYWEKSHAEIGSHKPLPLTYSEIKSPQLDEHLLSLAKSIGDAAACIDVIDANFWLGSIFTSLMSQSIRSTNGVFYTPPVLVQRLIYTVEESGFDFRSSKIVDPACGCGAFLIPLALKIKQDLELLPAHEVMIHMQSHLFGMELDPFAAWLAQVFLEIALMDIIHETQCVVEPLITIGDTLENRELLNTRYDLVIGNPPYGKIKLDLRLRERYKESLFGHANLYGLFSHLGADILNQNGMLAFLTPTSFLSGEYFKNLRQYLRKTMSPVAQDFVTVRKGVFEDVLQETMLSTYRKSDNLVFPVRVHEISTENNHKLKVQYLGAFLLPEDKTAPWLLPRSHVQSHYISQMRNMHHNLNNWGYKVSTGQLVWNRHKDQLKNTSKNAYPIIWAESITPDGKFKLKAEKRNHVPFFRSNVGDEWLITKKSCILLQRTTSKEQDKRLIAAALPIELISKYKGVVVENHLNMIVPISDNPRISPEVLAVFLNSKAVNEAFRTISGSVAVSAYELESLPLPDPDSLKALIHLVECNAHERYEDECFRIYSIGD